MLRVCFDVSGNVERNFPHDNTLDLQRLLRQGKTQASARVLNRTRILNVFPIICSFKISRYFFLNLYFRNEVTGYLQVMYKVKVLQRNKNNFPE